MSMFGTQHLTDLRKLRRDLHQIPEEGYAEYKTQQYILHHLSQYPCFTLQTVCGTGVRAVMLVDGASQTVAFRADMDALCIPENSSVEYASTHAGYMHGCGHDGHMAMALELATLLGSGELKPKANVVLLFQPAEESTGGADPMVQAGCLKNPDVDEIYGFHIWPEVPQGKVGIQEGVVMAQTSEISVDFEGLASHGAMPHMGKDAMLAAASFLVQAQGIVARGVDPAKPALLTFGKFESGHRRNIVSPFAHLEGIIRTFDDSVYQSLVEQLKLLLQGVGVTYGVKAELIQPTYYPAVSNHPVTTGRAIKAAGDKVVPMVKKMTAEDFSFFQKACPGTFMFLGAGRQNQPPLHADNFDFDESIMLIGVEIMAKLCGAIPMEEA